jgi:hypothetical protein
MQLESFSRRAITAALLAVPLATTPASSLEKWSGLQARSTRTSLLTRSNLHICRLQVCLLSTLVY